MYDPIVEPYPKSHQQYPDSYWAKSIEKFPETTSLVNDIQADIAIIGAGYTGLSSAYHLAKKYGKSVVVIEANDPGWGCSGRNAGFVLPGTGRLSLLDMEQKWGRETAQSVFQEYMESIDTVNDFIEQGNIDCDKTPGGYLKLAHKRAKVEGLRKQAEKLSERYGESVKFVCSQEVNNAFLKSANMFGGIYFDKSFAVNPMKLVLGYYQMATEAGVKVFSNSPVINWQQKTNHHCLYTQNGRVTAEKVIIATNGYTGSKMHPLIANRHFPVLSSIIVTRPLKISELATIQLKAGLMAMDTRRMKYYYRLLPDNRILFGGRGAINGKKANNPINKKRLAQGLKNTFPVLDKIDIDHFWSGWVSASYDNYPRINHSEDKSIHYSMGYCGSGLAFSTLAGKRLAQNICEPESLPNLPFWQSQLPKFPFSQFRRVGLSAYYALASLRD
ncbi:MULTISPECIES: NAD(P)/FAD-dependent oxidoreductase [Aliiglaciecola]|uniref:NAD(P)/FAD-dependent oxidoreductase n=1 Tax=Aliiglaciecola TaxID=1406885 RepID=UPI001C0A5269|nr:MULTISPECIES: FAD-binding oxidoreductase [Aliiglaciecola]MBU2879431.1 FAD-binding oxidoreductase [Aliiglaciecola lipolytica]MDO6712473.1 FAD-binding oxidoreductase [Aliiglaciecola sp. 2_MG-2023]MDO6753469.1 FAD-binding oxidoreductase [Aliiglaciecola sp. 1_MG-2023]